MSGAMTDDEAAEAILSRVGELGLSFGEAARGLAFALGRVLAVRVTSATEILESERALLARILDGCHQQWERRQRIRLRE